MPPKRPLAVSSASRINIDDEDDRQITAKVLSLLKATVDVKKRIVEGKENLTRPTGKNVVTQRKTSSTLTSMYGDDDDDELASIVPKKTRKPSKPKAKPSEDQPTTKPKKQPKHRDPSPEQLTEESSLDSIQQDNDNTPNTSLEWFETSVLEPAPKKRGRPSKSASATPQPQAKPRARSTSAQPASSQKAAAGVKGRKPKLAVVPETQVEEVSVIEEVEFVAKPRQGSILPASVTKKPSFERPVKNNRVKELQTQAEKNFALYKERAEKRFKATDELVTSLTAQLEHQKDTFNPSQLKDLESKVKSLQEELQRANTTLAQESSQNEVLSARLASRNQAATAQLREELHSDLSGLIFRNVERVNGNTVFDCLQTGRNGTLHYKLMVEDKDVNNAHGQIAYVPLLDADRDEKILRVLPDYLTDEIMFAREQASMFYWRLNQYLQKKVD